MSHQFVPINALYLPDFFNEEPVKQEQAPSETAPLTEHDTNLWLFEEDDECFQKALHALNEFSDAMADATDNEFDASSSSTSTYSSITDNNDGGMALSARTCGRKRSRLSHSD